MFYYHSCCRYDEAGSPLNQQPNKPKSSNSIPEKKRAGFFKSGKMRTVEKSSISSACDAIEIETSTTVKKIPQINPLPDSVVIQEPIQTKEIGTSIDQRKLVTVLNLLCQNLCTEDVINNAAFCSAIGSSAETLINYMELYKKHKETSTRINKNTDLFKINSEIQQKINNLKSLMETTGAIKVALNQGMTGMMSSLNRKQELLSKVLASYQVLIDAIRQTKICTKLKKRVGQVATETITSKKKLKDAVNACHLKIKILNHRISWQNAFLNIENGFLKSLPPSLTSLEIVKIAQLVENEVFVPVDNIIPNEFKSEIVDIIVEKFPVMLIVKGSSQVLINFHEFVLEKESFTFLLGLNV